MVDYSPAMSSTLHHHAKVLDQYSASDLKYLFRTDRFPTLFELDNYRDLFNLSDQCTLIDDTTRYGLPGIKNPSDGRKMTRLSLLRLFV
jgi:hypothetical protein